MQSIPGWGTHHAHGNDWWGRGRQRGWPHKICRVTLDRRCKPFIDRDLGRQSVTTTVLRHCRDGTRLAADGSGWQRMAWGLSDNLSSWYTVGNGWQTMARVARG